MTATCMSAVFNSTTMHCGLYREYQSASNSSSQEEQLILQRDVSTTTAVAVESGTTDGTHESDMSTTKQTITSSTEIGDTSTVTNRITSKATKEASTSTGKTTILTTEATTISSQQKNWTILGDMPTTTNFTEAKITEDNFSVRETAVGETATAPSSPQQKNWTILGAADCFWTTSLDYSGTISYTVSGIPCQYWNTNSPHDIWYHPVDTTALESNYCRESTYSEGGPGCYTTSADVMWEFCYIVKCDACGVDERLPVIPSGTTYQFHIDKFIGMVFTCDTLTSGTSVDHCPVAQCGLDDQWTAYSTSCTLEDCYTDSTTYQGKVTCTSSGIPCIVWTNQPYKPASPDMNTNYCRDPTSDGAPWCYTSDPNVPYDYCPVPKC